MKVLSIDGGGIRGVFPATILQCIEQRVKEPIHKHFDLLAGTSTGAIIAASLTLEKSMSNVVKMYEIHGKDIFHKQSFLALFQTFYKNKRLKSALRDFFGEIRLGDISIPLVIPTVNISKGKTHVFRSGYFHESPEDHSIYLWEAVLSSCSAPIFFPPIRADHRFLAVDGGLWANNPSLLCLTEAMVQFGQTISDIQMLSIGTGEQEICFPARKAKGWGIQSWLPLQFHPFKLTPKLLDLALNLSSESISAQCQVLCGSKYVRINQELHQEIPFDDVTSVRKLIQMAEKVYQKQQKDILPFFESTPDEKNHGGGETKGYKEI
ncbi:CBASS cGAMP-activated phospholipase [Caldalkalibacillus mannanilyticus]|uniref:CBASS cGAMP-activated phospholipase n=1 Tax=Caldalkalibacillus mannanilyticus TaxID=1418 RepID=UPI00046A62EC|nr:CBASS cGAMP-activated phospholipase [Caldalkalibacillus mannanilyticus]